jgi:diacylglycerol kinase (ATP)
MRSSKKPKKTYSKGLIGSFIFALEGIAHTLRAERNMRVHFLAGFLVLLIGIYIHLSAIEFMLLSVTICFVLMTEMFNTAVEHAIDLIEENYHPLAKIIKDIAAGAVFVSVINAVVVGYLLLFKNVKWRGGYLLAERVIQSPAHLTFIAIVGVVGLVLLLKLLRHEKMLLRGGMPSGHSAVAFAVWAAVSMVTGNALVSILVLFLAVLVARSRMTGGVHDIWEVIAGSFLGALVTLLVFQLLSTG